MRLARAALVLSLASIAACSGVSEAERSAVARYTDSVAPHAREGGRIVVQEIRPSLSRLSSGEITGAQFRNLAVGWRNGMTAVRNGFADAPGSDTLEPIAKVFDESFELYLAAIEQFIAASDKTGEALRNAISAAVPTAEEADQTYDRAVERLRKERKRVGLPPVSVP